MEREYVVLSKRLKATKAYYAPRIEPEHLKAAACEGRAAIQHLNGGIEAFAALWTTNEPLWLELGTVWLSEELRGNGRRHELMAEVMQLAPQGSRLFLFTSVGSIVCSAVELGFRPVTTKTHPGVLLWASYVGVVCRLPDSIHPIAPRKWGVPEEGKRWLFMR